MTTTEKALSDDLLSLEKQLCFAVYATEHAFQRAYKPLLAELGLTYPQYLAMMVLWEGKPLTVNDIGRRLGLDSGTLSPLLKRLETARFINRQRARDDERRVEVALTDKGRQAKEKAQTVAASIAIKTGCSMEEAGMLLNELNDLRRRLLAAD